MSTLSFDASAKIKKGDVKGYFNHVFRKEKEQARGQKMNHGNPDIDSTMTDQNMTFYTSNDGYGRTPDERFNNRLADYNHRKKDGSMRKLREDAVLLRGLILQPSADLFENKSLEEKKKMMKEFAHDAMPFIFKSFGGTKNIIGTSVHFDETNPHLHTAFMPMTDDGKLSQKHFFTGPAQLRQFHKDFRKHMNDKGWSFDEENKNEDTKHYEQNDYKRNAKAIEKARQEYTNKKHYLLGDDKIRKEVESTLELALEPKIKSVLSARYLREYKDKENDLERREEALRASEDDLRVRQERLTQEQGIFHKKKLDFEDEQKVIREKSFKMGFERGVRRAGQVVVNRYDTPETKVKKITEAVKTVKPTKEDFDLEL